MRWQWACFIVFGLAIAVPGCRKVLNEEKSFDLKPGNENDFAVDAVKKEQKIKVEVTSPGVPLNVFVFLKKDEQAAKMDISAGKKTDNVLASERKTENATLEATIPANCEAVIQIRNVSTDNKTANVKLKITN
jgi:hypothetical protein